MTTIETLTVLLSVSTGQTNITAGLNPAVMLYYWAIWRDVIPLHLSGMIRFFKIPMLYSTEKDLSYPALPTSWKFSVMSVVSSSM